MAQKSGTINSPTQQSAPTKGLPKTGTTRQPKQLPPYNVVLLNDNEHTYEYVILLLQSVFAYPMEKGFQLAKQVDQSSRAIVFTSHKEHAELKRDQILSYGADDRVANCKGSMSAVIEPA